MALAVLTHRDYTLMLDKSGSMSSVDQPGGKSRWEMAQESTLGLASKCEQFDPDGITVYLFSDRFQRYDNVTSTKVAEIFQENSPSGGTNLVAALQHPINNYFQRKAAGQAKPEGETILVVSDGEPDNRMAVVEVIINATQKIQGDEELAISFIQVGSDRGATRFYQGLDEQLQGIGAKFDICDTLTLDEMDNMTLTEVLLKAITD